MFGAWNCVGFGTLLLALNKCEFVGLETKPFAHHARYQLSYPGSITVCGGEFLVPLTNQSINMVYNIAEHPAALRAGTHLCDNDLSIICRVRNTVQQEEQAWMTQTNSGLPAMKESIVDQLGNIRGKLRQFFEGKILNERAGRTMGCSKTRSALISIFSRASLRTRSRGFRWCTCKWRLKCGIFKHFRRMFCKLQAGARGKKRLLIIADRRVRGIAYTCQKI